MPAVSLAVSRAALAGGLFLFAAAASSAMESADAEITIDNFTFAPTDRTIAAGTRVTWINRDDIPHTVVDADEPRAVKSPPLDTGERFAHTFATAGTFRYFCSLHPRMQGTIRVQ